MKASPGYTLIEIMVVLGLVGIIMVMLQRAAPNQQSVAWRSLPDRLNTFLIFARSQALKSERAHRLVCYRMRDQREGIRLEQATPDPEKPGVVTFEVVEPLWLADILLDRPIKWARIMQNGKNIFTPDDQVAIIPVSKNGVFVPTQIDISSVVNDVAVRQRYDLEPFMGQLKSVNIT